MIEIRRGMFLINNSTLDLVKVLDKIDHKEYERETKISLNPEEEYYSIKCLKNKRMYYSLLVLSNLNKTFMGKNLFTVVENPETYINKEIEIMKVFFGCNE